MAILETLFILSTTFYTVHADNENACPATNCGSLTVYYPFKLPKTQPQNDCHYINLKCNTTLDTDHATATVSLPYAGDFYVRNIDYYELYIQLYDPRNCLMRQLMNNFNLSSSSLRAVAYENYTFYTCPADIEFIRNYFSPIHCLSNSTNSTFASSFLAPEEMLESGCQIIGSWLIPVSYEDQFDFHGSNGDLYLTWNSTSCEHGTTQQQISGRSKRISAILDRSPYFFLAFVATLSLTLLLLRIRRIIGQRNESNLDTPVADGLPISSATTTAQQVRSSDGGLDESKIKSCTEMVVLSESTIIPGPDSQTCSICLETYCQKDTIRLISKCGHCFHADCIQQWLEKNSSCPVCRTSLSIVAL